MHMAEVDWLSLLGRFALYTESSKVLFVSVFNEHWFFVAYGIKELIGVCLFLFAQEIHAVYAFCKRRLLLLFRQSIPHNGLIASFRYQLATLDDYDDEFLRHMVTYGSKNQYLFFGFLFFAGLFPIPWVQSFAVLMLLLMYPKIFGSIKTFLQNKYFLVLYIGSLGKVVCAYTSWFNNISFLPGWVILSAFIFCYVMRRTIFSFILNMVKNETHTTH